MSDRKTLGKTQENEAVAALERLYQWLAAAAVTGAPPAAHAEYRKGVRDALATTKAFVRGMIQGLSEAVQPETGNPEPGTSRA